MKKTVYSLRNDYFLSVDFKEQINNLRDYYSIPAKIVQEKTTPGYIMYPVSKLRVKVTHI